MAEIIETMRSTTISSIRLKPSLYFLFLNMRPLPNKRLILYMTIYQVKDPKKRKKKLYSLSLVADAGGLAVKNSNSTFTLNPSDYKPRDN